MVKYMKNEIEITYPRTEYSVLNQEIKKYIDSILTDFLAYGEAPIQPNFPYSLESKYTKYTYESYISYVFFTSMATGGAHPNNTIHTITYDKTKNQIVDIDQLVTDDPMILETLSKESRQRLKMKPIFQDSYANQDMLLAGTEATKENFRNFAFSKEGLILFFEQYQVAPYSFGKFQVVISYDKIYESR